MTPSVAGAGAAAGAAAGSGHRRSLFFFAASGQGDGRCDDGQFQVQLHRYPRKGMNFGMRRELFFSTPVKILQKNGINSIPRKTRWPSRVCPGLHHGSECPISGGPRPPAARLTRFRQTPSDRVAAVPAPSPGTGASVLWPAAGRIRRGSRPRSPSRSGGSPPASRHRC
jgi:hypothetical protein